MNGMEQTQELHLRGHASTHSGTTHLGTVPIERHGADPRTALFARYLPSPRYSDGALVVIQQPRL